MKLTPEIRDTLVTLVMEESSEVIKAQCKIDRFGEETIKPSTGRTGLQELKIELVDLFVVLSPLIYSSELFPMNELHDLVKAKREKLRKYNPEIWGVI